MKKPLVPDSEESLGLRAAWLHYVGGLTQAAVAKRLGLPSVKTHRLIARAVAEGAVKVTIDGDIVACVELESRLCARFGLNFCRVTPDLAEEGLPLRALGLAGAEYLRNLLSNNPDITIGIGHGRTLSAAIHQLPHLDASHARFVSLLGCLTRNYALNPHDVMHRIAEKTGAQAYMMPVPFFANTVEDREVLLSQRGVSEVFSMAAGSTVKLVGIGTVEPAAQLVEAGLIAVQEINDISAAGAIGEMLGHFFDARGQRITNSLTARTLAVTLDARRRENIVALVGGQSKVAATKAVLASGLLSGLITDEQTARPLLAEA
ncbi:MULTISPECIES: sugar-binding transcriptional regulator [Enterobacterales]|jgi:DNA-binding transcriptional regulator LsrR (DeoR family)|uniref:Sugar-binding transcriptional regulator n=2 Tax=Enterobacteriaceae TaxID=543 RepID=A0AAX3Z4N4_9ENTR|nr:MULTISPECIES: sugar-binding transcriptional regulator [Enterobacterales]EFB2703788.1 sugar-binding transcriptional regulator [Escherichia coli O157:H7]GJL09659.1 DNA-binding transcriptional regulator [Klebsiella pneumoniae]ASD57880.1 ERI operon repressor [Enterobacter cloacae complex sp. ECNIH7]EEX2877390.1 sugar-binding transcriptional regulator [Escherichia coli]EFB1757922.1 sugar-binding transcriptional regulator [Escherichia coli]